MRATLALIAVVLAPLFLTPVVPGAATPKEAIGFTGTISGVVKSTAADGQSFVLKVSKAEPDESKSDVKDGGPMGGKEVTLGVRMPRKDGKPYPSPDDVAYIKSLKPGQSIKVKVFAVKSNPRVIRIQGPGEDVPAADAK